MKILNSSVIEKSDDVYCIEVNHIDHNFILEYNLVVSNCGSSCHGSTMASGSSTVFVNGKPLSRIGDQVACGSSSAQGSPDVFAGG